MKVTVAIDLPVDQSDLESVSNMAKEGGWTLALVHVVSPVVLGSLVGLDGYSVLTPPIETSTSVQEAELETVAEALRSTGLSVTTDVRVGILPDAIIDAAESESTSMIVAPSAHHHFKHRVLLGSVLSGLLKTSDRPVLVLPAAKRVEPGFDAAMARLHDVAERCEGDVDLDEVTEAAEACRAEPESEEKKRTLHDALKGLESRHPEFLIAVNQLRFVLFFNGL